MDSGLKRFFDQWKRVRSGVEPVFSVVNFPPNKCLPENTVGYRIAPESMSFTLRLNEMYLAENRQWWVTFDPLVVIVSEFTYGGENIAVPCIVGPGLIPDPQNAGASKYGTVLEDTLIAGPHPYRGGDVVISVRFYRVQRDNFVRSVLRTVEALSKLSANLYQLETSAAVGGAILTSIEGLLGLSTTVCLAAYRGSLVRSLTRPFAAQCLALLTPSASELPSALNPTSPTEGVG
jgi:hypothetical protein